MALKDAAAAGSFWFPYGRTKIGTFKPVVSGTVTLHYEAHPTLLGLTAADAALDVPEDWTQALIDFVAWRAFERLEKDGRGKAAYHRDQYYNFVRRARPLAERDDGLRAFPRIQDF